jgi:sensor histidine kinase YesM
MLQLPKIIKKTLSVRIGLMVVTAMTFLLMATMIVMLVYSRKAVKEEATQKALVTLDCTIRSIDNILLNVEQTTGNIYFNMLPHMDDPDMMFIYARKLVETNPYVVGCAIAFKEDYFKGRHQFMAYMHLDDSANVAYASTKIVSDEMFANEPYTRQSWYTQPMEARQAGWMNPLNNMDTDEAPIITFSLPIITQESDGKPVGVLGVDVSLSQLSTIVNNTKASPNSYCALIDKDGTFIVHPNSGKLWNKTEKILNEQSAKEAANAMISGGSGMKPFRMGGTDYYVFYKPFKRISIQGRTTEALNWSGGIVYPEDDIFGEYQNLTYYVLAIAILGLLLSFLISRLFIHQQLKPLLMLTERAKRIAKGNWNEPIPDSRREDEIGRLQDNFKLMQESLATNIGELEQLTTDLKKHSEELDTAYRQAQKADRMKTAFLHNMTNQMLAPSEAILKDVETLCDTNHKKDRPEMSRLADDIQQSGENIADVLKNLINMSDEDFRKEAEDA